MTNTRPKCASPKCTNLAHTTYTRYCRKHAYATGELSRRVDAAMARQRLQRIINAGGTITGVSKATGVDRVPLKLLLSGKSKTIQQSTHRKIMSVTTGQTIAYVPAWQITRRIRALRAAGWQMQELVERTGLEKSALTAISAGRRDVIRRSTAIVIRDAYTQLAAQPVRPPTPWVSRQHWAKPMEWDNIDDPNEQRDGIALGRLNPEFVTANRVKPDEALHAKLADLHAHYGTQKNLADALDVHPSSIAHHMNHESKTIDVGLYVHIMNHQPDQKETAA